MYNIWQGITQWSTNSQPSRCIPEEASNKESECSPGSPTCVACALSQVLGLILTYWVVMLLRVILTMALFILDNVSWIWLKVVIGHLLLPHIATTTTTTTTTTTETRYFSS